jgi:hypothetical protein
MMRENKTYPAGYSGLVRFSDLIIRVLEIPGVCVRLVISRCKVRLLVGATQLLKFLGREKYS